MMKETDARKRLWRAAYVANLIALANLEADAIGAGLGETATVKAAAMLASAAPSERLATESDATALRAMCARLRRTITNKTRRGRNPV